MAALEGARYDVASIKRERKERRPWPPFTTSTLQQGASARLHMAPAETMKHAQQLYEGVALGAGQPVGLITYMRTDSTAVSPEAQAAARAFIEEQFGARYRPEHAPRYAGRVKNAQEAHEAIRPTDVRRTPESLKPILDRRQWQLYDLIWRRFVASQMAPAVYDVTTVDVAASGRDERRYLFRAIGRVLLFDGFLRVLDEPEEQPEDEDGPQQLPELAEGERLDLLALIPRQHFTRPPPRYTEAALIKALEERGIGRPSTYAGIMATIKERDYVVVEQRRLAPTPLGEAVCDALVATFPSVMDYAFTAEIEDRLDAIARGEREWTAVLGEWYAPFAQALDGARDVLKAHARARPAVTADVTADVTAEAPEASASRAPARRGGRRRAGAGAASGTQRRAAAKTRTGARPRRRRPQAEAPAAKAAAAETATATTATATTSATPDALGTCPECGRALVQRTSQYGPFVGCSGFPRCRYIQRDRPGRR
jgi:DNA topoisomerase-1